MKTKNEIWNSFIGKKILLINPDAESVEVAVVTGCDPDIGICLNSVGDPEPHTILLGKSAPNYRQRQIDESLMLEDWFKMIQSGYFSYPEDERLVIKIFGGYVEGGRAECPYSV